MRVRTNLVIATIPDLAQALGKTNPEPVSAYVVIIERNEAALKLKFSINVKLDKNEIDSNVYFL